MHQKMVVVAQGIGRTSLAIVFWSQAALVLRSLVAHPIQALLSPTLVSNLAPLLQALLLTEAVELERFLNKLRPRRASSK